MAESSAEERSSPLEDGEIREAAGDAAAAATQQQPLKKQKTAASSVKSLELIASGSLLEMEFPPDFRIARAMHLVEENYRRAMETGHRDPHCGVTVDKFVWARLPGLEALGLGSIAHVLSAVFQAHDAAYVIEQELVDVRDSCGWGFGDIWPTFRDFLDTPDGFLVHCPKYRAVHVFLLVCQLKSGRFARMQEQDRRELERTDGFGYCFGTRWRR